MTETHSALTAINDLAARLIDVQAQMEPLKALEADLKAKIRELMLPGRTTLPGGHIVTVTPGRKLDTAKLAQAFPPGEHPGLYRLELDAKAARAHLAPAELEKFMVANGENRVSVK